MLEREIEQHLVVQVKKIGGWCLKFVSVGVSGVPDRIIIHNGSVVFVEVKAPNKKPRPLQLRIMDRLRSHGMRVEVVDTKGGVDELVASL